MHNLGCPKRNNPYADCDCAAMEQREHTEQLRQYNDNARKLEANPDILALRHAEETIASQSKQIEELKTQLTSRNKLVEWAKAISPILNPERNRHLTAILDKIKGENV